MLKQKPQTVRREEYEQKMDIAGLPKSVDREEEWNNAKIKAKSSAEAAAKLFVEKMNHAQGLVLVEGLAAFNDKMLRALLGMPTPQLANSSERQKSLRQLFRWASEYVVKNFPGTRVGDFSRRIGALEPSLLQLAEVVVSKRKRNAELTPESKDPYCTFATSVWLDVYLGVDLVEVLSRWDERERLLRMGVVLYQAKASRTRLADQQIREEARRYEQKQLSLRRDFDIDPDWLVAGTERSFVSASKEDVAKALSNAEHALQLIRKLSKQPRTNPMEEFVYADVLYRLTGLFTGDEQASKKPKPTVHVRPDPVFRFIFDTTDSLRPIKILSPEEAMTYPRSVQAAVTGPSAGARYQQPAAAGK